MKDEKEKIEHRLYMPFGGYIVLPEPMVFSVYKSNGEILKTKKHKTKK